MLDFFGAPWTSRDAYTLRPDARRFENWENAYALRCRSLRPRCTYADQIGIDAIEARVAHLGAFCAEAAGALPGVTNMDLGALRAAALPASRLTAPTPTTSPPQLRKSGFSVGTSSAGTTRIDAEKRDLSTLLRIAPHYYNTEGEIARCVQRLGELMNT